MRARQLPGSLSRRHGCSGISGKGQACRRRGDRANQNRHPDKNAKKHSQKHNAEHVGYLEWRRVKFPPAAHCERH